MRHHAPDHVRSRTGVAPILVLTAATAVGACFGGGPAAVTPEEIPQLEQRLESEPNNGQLLLRYSAALFAAQHHPPLGADPTIRDDNGFSVEDWAKIEMSEGLADVLDLLRRATAKSRRQSARCWSDWIRTMLHGGMRISLQCDLYFNGPAMERKSKGQESARECVGC